MGQYKTHVFVCTTGDSCPTQGNVTLQPKREPEGSIDILDVVNDVASRNIKMPVLIRFQDVLRRRVTLLSRRGTNE